MKLPSDRAVLHKIPNSFGQEGSLLSNDVGDKEAIEQGSSVGESEREKLGGRAPRLFSPGFPAAGGRGERKVKQWKLEKAPTRRLQDDKPTSPDVGDTPVAALQVLFLCGGSEEREKKGSRWALGRD